MKKLVPLMVMLCFVLWIGCGDDEVTNGDTTVPLVRVVANNSAGTPSMESANDNVWDNVESFEIEVTRGGSHPTKAVPKATVVAQEATVQAINNGTDLFLRFIWLDTSFNVWREHFYVSEGGGLYVNFDQKDAWEAAEDQLFVLFEEAAGSGKDAWNWRSLTTGNFAEGFTYEWIDSVIINISLDTIFIDTELDSLITDTTYDSTSASLPHLVVDVDGSGPLYEVGIANSPHSSHPTYVHQDTCEFTGYLLYVEEAMHRSNDPIGIQWVDTLINPTTEDTTFDTIYSYWPTSEGWEMDQKVPGWMIWGEMMEYTDAQLGSRWDIRTVMDYDSANGEYTVVLKRHLNTGFADDVNMSTIDSIKTRLVIMNNRDDLFVADTWRGVSKEFWIVF